MQHNGDLYYCVQPDGEVKRVDDGDSVQHNGDLYHYVQPDGET